MSNKRSTLKKIAVTGVVTSALPSSWRKPIVNSVVLPAHAEMSPSGSVLFDRGNGEETFIVPDQVTQLEITMSGGGGGAGSPGEASLEGEASIDFLGVGGRGGDGELINISVSVSAGDILSLSVGRAGVGGIYFNGNAGAADAYSGQPGTATAAAQANGRFTGGGSGGGGGRSSWIEVGGQTYVASGGGGGGGAGHPDWGEGGIGGNGEGVNGGAGGSGEYSPSDGLPGGNGGGSVGGEGLLDPEDGALANGGKGGSVLIAW